MKHQLSHIQQTGQLRGDKGKKWFESTEAHKGLEGGGRGAKARSTDAHKGVGGGGGAGGPRQGVLMHTRGWGGDKGKKWLESTDAHTPALLAPSPHLLSLFPTHTKIQQPGD